MRGLIPIVYSFHSINLTFSVDFLFDFFQLLRHTATGYLLWWLRVDAFVSASTIYIHMSSQSSELIAQKSLHSIWCVSVPHERKLRPKLLIDERQRVGAMREDEIRKFKAFSLFANSLLCVCVCVVGRQLCLCRYWTLDSIWWILLSIFRKLKTHITNTRLGVQRRITKLTGRERWLSKCSNAWATDFLVSPNKYYAKRDIAQLKIYLYSIDHMVCMQRQPIVDNTDWLGP